MKTLGIDLKFLRAAVRSGRWTYKVRQGVAVGLRRKGGLGFIPRRLSPEDRFLLELDLEGQIVYDVGGYEGVFTLFFAKSVGPSGQVLTFEPNPINCRRIWENIRLNRLDNVRLLQLGLGARSGKCKLVFWANEPARGTLNASYQESLRRAGQTTSVEVEVDSLDHQLVAQRLPPPDFIKIDVEAAELQVLEGMHQTLALHHPRLFIEVHSGVDIRRLAQCLFEARYRLHHIESGTQINLTNTESASNGHLYCVADVASRVKTDGMAQPSPVGVLT